MRSREIRETDVAVHRRGKNLTEVCSVHLRVTIASVFRGCCDLEKNNYGGVILGNEAQQLGTVSLVLKAVCGFVKAIKPLLGCNAVAFLFKV